MFLNVCNDLKGDKKNFEVIPILRQEDKNIKSERFIKLSGSQYQFDEKEFLEIVSDNKSAMLIDLWGDKTSAQAIKLLPAGSTILLLGNLSEKEALQLNCNDLFMCHKQIEGFNLLKFMKDELTKE